MSNEFPSALNPESDADWEAIGRFVAGESDPHEASQVAAWLAAHPEDAAFVAMMQRRTTRIASRADLAVDTEAALSAVRARMEAPTLSVVRGGSGAGGGAIRATSSSMSRRWSGVLVAIAATVLLAAGVRQWRSSTVPAAEALSYVTVVGQRDSLQLPDGSTVVLAPGSRLTAAAGFGTAHRGLTLEGAAYFDVRHQDALPFTIRSGNAEIRDLGTAFSVKQEASGQVSVAVTHGVVALRDVVAATAPVELQAGDRGVLSRGAVQVARGIVTDADVAWTRGLLAYRDAPLHEVQDDLRRWYGIELEVTDPTLAGRTLTASFLADSSAQVLRVIALALGAELVQRGDTIRLQPHGPAPASRR